MTAPEVLTDNPSLFDDRTDYRARGAADPVREPEPELTEPERSDVHTAESLSPDAEETPASAEPTPGTPGPQDRKRLEEQLEQLKRKEAELRRALIIADHPELADAVRAIQGRAYAVTRAEEKLSQGLSKSEARRRETIEKKLSSLRDKRAELDQQIETLEREHHDLGTERLSGFHNERREALEQLLIALGLHEPALAAIGVDPNSLMPEIAGWLPEIEAIARELSAAAER